MSLPESRKRNGDAYEQMLAEAKAGELIRAAEARRQKESAAELEKRIEEGVTPEEFEKQYGIKPDVPSDAVIIDIAEDPEQGTVSFKYAVKEEPKPPETGWEGFLHRMIHGVELAKPGQTALEMRILPTPEELTKMEQVPYAFKVVPESMTYMVKGAFGLAETPTLTQSLVKAGVETSAEPLAEWFEASKKKHPAQIYGELVGAYWFGKALYSGVRKAAELVKPKLPTFLEKRFYPVEYGRKQIAQQLSWGEEKYLSTWSYETYLSTQEAHPLLGYPTLRRPLAGYGLIQTEPSSAFAQILARRGPPAMGGTTLPPQLLKPVQPRAWTPETFRNILLRSLKRKPTGIPIPFTLPVAIPTAAEAIILKPGLVEITKEQAKLAQKEKAIQVQVHKQLQKQRQISTQITAPPRYAPPEHPGFPYRRPSPQVYRGRRETPTLIQWFLKTHPIPSTSEVATRILGTRRGQPLASLLDTIMGTPQKTHRKTRKKKRARRAFSLESYILGGHA